MKKNNPMLSILIDSRRIEQMAARIYKHFSISCIDPALKKWWKNMAREELKHHDFWDLLIQKAEVSAIPTVFAEPGQTAEEIKAILSRAKELFTHYRKSESVNDMFILAYRLEFYMLYPAFELLFQLLSPLVKGDSPDKSYDQHINGFIAMFKKKGAVTPELQLLGETLGGLWKVNKELAIKATTDPLTSLLNRRGFMSIAQQMVYLSRRTEDSIGILMADIDHFKKINDAYGHQTGDRVLAAIADSLREALRRSDLIGRYGGEEFIIYLPGVKKSKISSVAEKLRSAAAHAKCGPVRPTISIGAVSLTLSKHAPEDILERLIKVADARLYKAKELGRNRVVDSDQKGTTSAKSQTRAHL
jgi:diguanylate cyclase (GGDEF)-like protein